MAANAVGGQQRDQEHAQEIRSVRHGRFVRAVDEWSTEPWKGSGSFIPTIDRKGSSTDEHVRSGDRTDHLSTEQENSG